MGFAASVRQTPIFHYILLVLCQGASGCIFSKKALEKISAVKYAPLSMKRLTNGATFFC